MIENRNLAGTDTSPYERNKAGTPSYGNYGVSGAFGWFNLEVTETLELDILSTGRFDHGSSRNTQTQDSKEDETETETCQDINQIGFETAETTTDTAIV